MMTTATEATEKAAKRREQLAEAKRRQRAKEQAAGVSTFEIKLTHEQKTVLGKAAAMYAGSSEEFIARALVTGAKFLANSGNKRGGKVRLS